MNKAIICAIIKNEHNYLDEWLKYHLSIGFSSIYLFEDYDSLSHKDIVVKYDNVILTTLEDFGISKFGEHTNNPYIKYSGRQYFLYDKFLETYKNSADWLAFIDIDEYISFSDNYDLEKIMNEFSYALGVYMCWETYGANGQIYKTSNNVQSRFLHPDSTPSVEYHMAVKSFINLHNYENNYVNDLHHGNGKLVNTFGLLTLRLIKNYHKIYIKHYFTKSWEEWCNRWLRGEANWGTRTLDYFFACNTEMTDQYNHLHELAKQWFGEELYDKVMQSQQQIHELYRNRENK